MVGPLDTLHMSVPSRPETVGEIRRAMAAFALDCGVPEERVQDIKTAVSEAATNAVIHAYADNPGELDIVATCDRCQVQVVVADRGSGMLPRRVSEGLGLGLPLMTTLTDRLEIVTPPDGRGTEIHMVFEFAADAARGDAAA